MAAMRERKSTAARVTSSHPSFGQQLDRNGVVFDRSCVKPPTDLEELLRDLNRQRDSKSPSECEYRAYLEAVDTSYNEETMTRAFDSLAKDQRKQPCKFSSCGRSRRYVRAYNLQLTETAAPTQEGISNPKPDVLEALTTAAYPAEALEQLPGVLAPTKHPPAMPAFVVHAKGPKGLMDEAAKQCAYDGSVMVYSAHEAHVYLEQSARGFHDHTQALTVAFNGEDLHIYANHCSQDGKYHSYPVSTEKPRFSFRRYCTTRRQLRNAQDWSRRRAEQMCDRLWDKAGRSTVFEQVTGKNSCIGGDGDKNQQLIGVPKMSPRAERRIYSPRAMRRDGFLKRPRRIEDSGCAKPSYPRPQRRWKYY